MVRMKRVLGVSVVFVALCAAAGWKDSRPVGDASLVEGGLRVDPVAENLFRVRVARDGAWCESGLNRYGIFRKDWPAVSCERKDATLSTAAAEIRVADGKVSFKSKVSAADFTVDVKEAGKGYELRFPLAEGERVYGLGDVSRANIQRRPGKYEIWVKNVNSYIPLPMALTSRGWGLLVNTTWRNVFDVGATDKDALVCTAKESEIDFYVFVGRDYRALLDIYTQLTGRPALLPAFGYGFTYVCNENVDMFRLLDEAMAFRDRDLPCDVIGLEPGWMEKFYDSSTRKEWSKQRFKFPYWAPAGGHTFVGALDRLGFKLSLWLCVDYDLFRYEEQCAAGEAKKSGGLVDLPEGIAESWEDDRIGTDEEKKKKAAQNRKSKLIDGGADLPEGKAPWFEHLKKFVQQGAQCFKLDGSNQVGEHPKRDWANGKTDEEDHNLYPLVYDKQMARGYEDFTSKRSMVYSASGYVGLQQFVATWAGDTGGGPRSCASLLNLGMSGHSNTSCDMGIYDSKSLHFGMLQTWSQQNNWCYWNQPWHQRKAALDGFRKYVKLRYRLMPYLYTAAAEASRTGWPAMRSLPFAYPDVPAYDACETTYMLGDNLLICAFTDTAEIPAGTWYEWRTDRLVTGPTQEKLTITPEWGGGLYVKAGAAIPTWPEVECVDKGWNEELVYEVFVGADGESELYEDDGLSLNYRKGGAFVARTKLTVKAQDGGTAFTIGPRQGGSFGGGRKVTVRFHGLAAKPAAATVGGKPVEGTWCDASKVFCVKDVDVGAGGATFFVK